MTPQAAPHAGLLAALTAALQGQAPPGAGIQPGKPGSKLMQAMSARQRPGDAKYARLGALPPYAEPQHADRFGGAGSATGGAFQGDSYQNDAYQV